jgi:cell division protein FtsI (penicillin-binding protein 3)
MVLTGLFVVIIVRLVVLQVVDGPRYASLAEQRRTNVRILQAKRGTIYDRNGNVLAMSEECYDVYCDPREVTDAAKEAELLATWLGGEASDYVDSLRANSTFVYLVKLADKDASESLRAELIQNGLGGVYLLPQTRRVYPYGEVAGQLLGMVSLNNNDQYEGISGLELMYNNQLAGKDGEMVTELGLEGIPIAGASAKVTEP